MFTIAEVAAQLDGEVRGDPATPLTGFAPADQARPGDLTFAENEAFFARAEQGAATAIIADARFSSSRKSVIRVKNPRVAFARALALFFPEPQWTPGIHPGAVVAVSAQIDPTAHIGPHCCIGERVRIGAGAVLQGGNFIGDDSIIGEQTRLFPQVTLYPRTELGRRVRIHAGAVIGSDGYGYVQEQGVHRKVPQIGQVIIGDDVEIGANTTVDRGALEATRIGRGSKIDNLVQIAHNVVIGEHCLVIAQAGIAGSTQLGDYVILAGQAGVAGHLKIGSQVTVAGQSGVMHDIPAGEKWFGSPAQPDRQMKRQIVAVTQLPDLLKRVAVIEEKLDA
jgi:UDP-3-O-[3-hydroxymyristoyl] glucosamine N-acyltransferase